MGPDGATHQALEDVALMRVLPNMTVVVPCDAVETEKAALALAERGRAGDVLARVPLIPGYNTEADRRESIRQLEGMGFGRFDEFTYITGLEYEKRKTDVLHFEGDSPADSGGE